MRPIATDVAGSVRVGYAVYTAGVGPAERLNRSRCGWGCDSSGSKKPRKLIRCWSSSPMGRGGTFEEDDIGIFPHGISRTMSASCRNRGCHSRQIIPVKNPPPSDAASRQSSLTTCSRILCGICLLCSFRSKEDVLSFKWSRPTLWSSRRLFVLVTVHGSRASRQPTIYGQ